MVVVLGVLVVEVMVLLLLLIVAVVVVVVLIVVVIVRGRCRFMIAKVVKGSAEILPFLEFHIRKKLCLFFNIWLLIAGNYII